MLDNAIRQNDKYYICIGEAELHVGDEQMTCYKIINKETNVVETETTILPHAIQFMEDFAQMLETPESPDHIMNFPVGVTPVQ